LLELENREICYKCYRPKSSCICEFIVNPIKTQTKFVILMHPKEFRKTKNGTGHMTNNSLENCELHVGIDFTNHKRVNELLNNKDYEPYVLYPDINSIKLNTQKLPSQKKSLVFIIDSTWPCSKKMLRLSKNLQNLRKISFEHDKSSQFKIKTQPNQYCLSTIESTLCVLEQLNFHENENIPSKSLENFLIPFEKMVDYQVKYAFDEKNIRYKPAFKKSI
jgi:DTW domain-containing protein YfiP